MKPTSIRFLELSLGAIATAFLAFGAGFLPWYSFLNPLANPQFLQVKWIVLTVVYTTALPFFYSLYRTMHLLHLIGTERAFSTEALRNLRHIQYAAWSIVCVYLLALLPLLLFKQIALPVLLIWTGVTATGSLLAVFASVLRALFANALDIQTENDLTI